MKKDNFDQVNFGQVIIPQKPRIPLFKITEKMQHLLSFYKKVQCLIFFPFSLAEPFLFLLGLKI
jgi:hypothetical protein